MKATLKNMGSTHSTYAEAYQRYPIRFALMTYPDKDSPPVPLHHLTKCREFLNDWVVWQHGCPRYTIYGFTIPAPFDVPHPVLFYELDDEQEAIFQSNIPVYTQLCDAWNNSPRTYIDPRIPVKGVIFHLPTLAKEATWCMSLWTLLLKCLFLVKVELKPTVKETLTELQQQMKKMPGNEYDLLDGSPRWDTLFISAGNNPVLVSNKPLFGNSGNHSCGILNYCQVMDCDDDAEGHKLLEALND